MNQINDNSLMNTSQGDLTVFDIKDRISMGESSKKIRLRLSKAKTQCL
jgi:hypothetical protein